MPPSLQTSNNSNYLARKAAENARRRNMIDTIGPTNPINPTASANAIKVAQSLVIPFPTPTTSTRPTRPTRPTRSASASSLIRTPSAPLPRVSSAPTLPTSNKGILGKTVNGLGAATKATGNALVTSGKVIGNVTGKTVDAIGNVTGKTVGAIGNVARKLKFWGGKRRRTRRAHKKNRSKRH